MEIMLSSKCMVHSSPNKSVYCLSPWLGSFFFLVIMLCSPLSQKTPITYTNLKVL